MNDDELLEALEVWAQECEEDGEEFNAHILRAAIRRIKKG